jgi:hypothetical protein
VLILIILVFIEMDFRYVWIIQITRTDNTEQTDLVSVQMQVYIQMYRVNVFIVSADCW